MITSEKIGPVEEWPGLTGAAFACAHALSCVAGEAFQTSSTLADTGPLQQISNAAITAALWYRERPLWHYLTKLLCLVDECELNHIIFVDLYPIWGIIRLKGGRDVVVKRVVKKATGTRILYSEEYIRHLAKFTKIESDVLMDALVEYLSSDTSQSDVALKFGIKQGKISQRSAKLKQLDKLIVEAIKIRDIRFTK